MLKGRAVEECDCTILNREVPLLAAAELVELDL